MTDNASNSSDTESMDYEVDIACTFSSNRTLRTDNEMTGILDRFKTISMRNQNDRAWIGHLENTLAIPFFENDNGTDYQIHFFSSDMNLLHLDSYKNISNVVDWQRDSYDLFVHSLFYTTEHGLKSLSYLYIVIPFGYFSPEKKVVPTGPAMEFCSLHNWNYGLFVL